MINKIVLKFGTINTKITSITPQPVNLIVGPNNSGKSLLLKEIQNYLTRENTNYKNYILNEMDFDILDVDTATNLVKSEIKFDNLNQRYGLLSKKSSNLFDGNNLHDAYNSYGFKQYVEFLTAPLTSLEEYQQDSVLRYFEGNSLVFLNGLTRLSSFENQTFNLDTSDSSYESNLINMLAADSEKLSQLRKFVFEAFNKHLNIYPHGSSASFVLTESSIPEHLDLSFKPEALTLLKSGFDNDKVSDGIKAYIGIIAEIISHKPKYILIDEPEAFLHPPLARKLGKIICQLAIDEGKQIFITSHSADFIMGCVEANTPLNILRLTYESGSPSATLVNDSNLKTMMTNPLLRSTSVLSGIFFKNVIVTESDSDRAFYQEINHRLKRYKPEWAIEDCLFLNAQNKQTVGWITSTLREIGIPTASVIDFDMIKDGGSVFTSYTKSSLNTN